MNLIRKKNLILIMGLLALIGCDSGSKGKGDAALFLSGIFGSKTSALNLQANDNQSGAVCNITASAGSVLPGQPVTFTLSAGTSGVERSGFTAGLSDSVGDLPATKTIIAPDATTRYELSVWDVDGTPTSFSCNTTLTVTPAPDSGAPLAACMLSLDKTTAAYGENITLSWTTTNASTGSLSPSRNSGVLDGTEIPNGTRTFPNYYGNTFNLRVWNSDGKWTDCSAQLNISTNSPPTAGHSAYVVDPGASVSGNLIAQDLERDVLVYKLERAPAQGTVLIDGATGAFTYTANAAATEGDSFTFSVNDGTQDSSAAVVRLNLTNAPVCSITASSTNVHSGEPITFTMTGAGSGVERSGFSAGLPNSVGDLPATKTIIAPEVSTRYALDVWTVDGQWVDYTCEVTVNVTPATDTNEDFPACELNIDKTVAPYGDTIALSWNTTGALTAEITPARAGGALFGAALPAGSRSFRNYYGENFKMRVWNKDGRWTDCATNLKYTGIDNAGPTASDSAYNLRAGAIISGTLRARDIENDALSFSVKNQPPEGTLSITNAATGEFTYQADPGASGIVSFSFAAADGTKESNEGVVRFKILPPVGAVGTVDLDFGTNGLAITDITTKNDYGNAVVIQADGKSIVGGYANQGIYNVYTLVRYNLDGTLDLSFGNGGIVLSRVGPTSSTINSLLIQADGKIIASGSSHNGKYQDYSLARYNTDGSLDTSFGDGGTVVTTLGGHNDFAYASALQADGKIILAGSTVVGDFDFGVVRYNTDGSLDTSFGSGGIVRTQVGDYHDYVSSVVVQDDGKIVVGGYIWYRSAASDRMVMVRYNTNGSLDGSFGSGGRVVGPQVGVLRSHANAMALQGDGKIVLAGESHSSSANQNFTLLRFNTNGSLDGSFGSGGMVFTDFQSSSDFARALVIQSDGKILVAGDGGTSTGYEFSLARYNLDGSPDTSFGVLGKMQTDIVLYQESVRALALQPDGKIMVAGMANIGAKRNNSQGKRNHAFALLRIK